jgi:hypothetical protein
MRLWSDITEKMNEWWTIVNITYEKRVNPKTLICPNCQNNTIHYFYYGKAGGRGGYWIWCSSCLEFMHLSSGVPVWWKEIEGVPLNRLVPEPEWLTDNLSKWEPILISYGID